MLEDIGSNAIVGTKQVLKAIAADQLACVYIAKDADGFLANKIKAACFEHGVAVTEVPTMRELGTACKIDVGAACAGLPK